MTGTYKNLNVWQKSIDLVEAVYRVTNGFPKEEVYGLTSQMRRAVVSISSNIAEGSRRKDLPEYLHFLRIADGSSAELETQVIIAKRLYPSLEYKNIDELSSEVQKMLHGLIHALSVKNLAPRTPAWPAGRSHLAPRSGFTLIELLVAVGLFAIIVSVGVGGFVRALRIQRQVSSAIATNSNASLVIEQMAREIRTGSNFVCSGGSPCSANELKFVNAKGNDVTYSLTQDALGHGVIMRTEGVNPPQGITSQNINVRYLEFRFFGNLPNDGYPPRITVFVGVSPLPPGVDSSVVNLQTTVSSRLLDS